MSRAQFETIIALYIIELSRRKDSGSMVKENSEIFDNFLEHVSKQPMAGLITAYHDADAETRLYYRRLLNDIGDKGFLRLMI